MILVHEHLDSLRRMLPELSDDGRTTMLLTALALAFSALEKSGVDVSYAVPHLAALSDGPMRNEEMQTRERQILDQFETLPDDALALLQALVWQRRPTRTEELVSALSHAADTHGGIESTLVQPELLRQAEQLTLLRSSSDAHASVALRLARSELIAFAVSRRSQEPTPIS